MTADREALIRAREEARTTEEILAAVARIEWANANQGADCPPDQIPTEADLLSWLPECPEPEREEALAQARETAHALTTDLVGDFGKNALALRGLIVLTFHWRDWLREGKLPENPGEAVACLHSAWRGLPTPRPKHPLPPLVRAWQRRPVEVEPEPRSDRIIPGPLAVIPKQHASRSQQRLFSTGYGVTRQPGEQLRLFDLEKRRSPCFPIEAFELSGGKTVSAGRGGPAPVELRLFVEGVLSVRTADRTGRAVAIEATGGMRGIAKKLWPKKRRIQKREYEALARAAAKLDALWIHLRDSQGRIRGGQRIVLVTHYAYPEGTGRGADPGRLRFVVDLPDGSDQGPVVSPTLNRWGNSAPAFRGLLNLAYRWHHPGKTRRPVRRGRHWVQVEDPSRYDRITDDLLVETFFPVSADRQKRKLIHRANRVLERLEKAGEMRVVDNRILPPKVTLTDE